MNILVITSLFPDSTAVDRTESTHAILNLLRFFPPDETVLVIKPIKVSRLGFFGFHRSPVPVSNVTVAFVPRIQVSRFGWDFARLFSWVCTKVLRKQSFRPDIVVSHYFRNHFYAARVARALAIPHLPVFHKRDAIEIESGGGVRYRTMVETAPVVLCRSRALRRRILDSWPHLAGKIELAESGIDAQHVLSMDAMTQQYQKIASDSVLHLVTVASLIPRKNHQYVIRALAAAREIATTYTIIGDGPLRSELEILAQELGVSDRVTFMGQLSHDQVLGRLSEYHVFVMVSERETFGLAYLEALAKGCLVIGARGWGIDGVVEHGHNGFLCTTGSTEEIVATIRTIKHLGNAQLEELARNAHTSVSALTERQASDRYLALINRAAQAHATGTIS